MASNSPNSVEMVLDDKFDIAFVTGKQFQSEFDHVCRAR